MQTSACVNVEKIHDLLNQKVTKYHLIQVLNYAIGLFFWGGNLTKGAKCQKL